MIHTSVAFFAAKYNNERAGVQELGGEVAVGAAGLRHPRAVPEGTLRWREGG